MIALWVAGGLLLVALVVSDGLRRREEIGYALTVGVSKARLGWQFMLEVWMVTLPAVRDRRAGRRIRRRTVGCRGWPTAMRPR